MPRKRREIPSFFSFEIGPVRGIAESLSDEDWGRWSKRALNDLSCGCTRRDTDPRVRKMYDSAKESMDIEYERKRKWYEEQQQKKTTGGAANGNNADESANAFENLGSAKPSTDGGIRKDPLNITTVLKNGSLESGTSVEKFNDQRRTGGISPLSSPPSRPPVRSGAVDVLNLAYSGEFGNVTLTQEQYAQLGIKFGNQQKLNRAIDSLSCQIENGERNPANHYAELVKWASYRDDMEEKEELRASTAPHYETVSEHNARIVRESDAWIHEYCQQQKKNRKAANG